MTALKTTLLALGLSSLSGLAMAAGNPLSVHVLNLENGIPTPGIEVTLEHQSKGQWQELSRGKTNEQGRITALYPEGKALAAGDYRVVFKTGDYYAGARFKGGTAAQLAVGVKVEVKGPLAADGSTIVAQEIEFDD